MFICDLVAPNGANTRYHKAMKFEIHPDAIHAVVNSYHSETMEMISWQETYTIPVMFKIETLDDVETILTTALSSPFVGGTIVPDETATLDSKKARKWAATKLERYSRMNLGIVTDYGMFDTDDIARANISGAVLAAVVANSSGQPFSISWTLKDNTIATLTANQMIQVGMLVMTYVDECHAASRTLREAIDAAEDTDTLDAIDIASGWPSNDKTTPV